MEASPSPTMTRWITKSMARTWLVLLLGKTTEGKIFVRL